MRHPTMPPQVDMAFEVPKGTPVHSMRTGGWTPAGRTSTIYPYKVDRYGAGSSEQYVVSWAGAGGYWRRVVIRDGEFVQGWHP